MKITLLALAALLIVGVTASAAEKKSYPVEMSILSTVKGTKREFLARILPVAEEVGAKYGIPASAIVSMAIYESYYGESSLAKAHYNYFGIKAFRDWRGRKAYKRSKDGVFAYRSYGSLREGVEDYAKFLQKARYKRAFRCSSGVQFVAAVLRSGYCPDDDYLDYIRSIVSRHRLSQLDA